MVQMLTCFTLKPGSEIEAYKSAYEELVDYMNSVGLVENTGPIGFTG